MSLTKAMQLFLQGRTLNGKTLQLSFYGILDKILCEILTIKVDDWKGIIISCPRNKWSDLKTLDEAHYSGVYFLWSKNKNLVTVYIGKADPEKFIKDRLRDHDRKKDWWSHCIFVTTIGCTLDPTALYYLESTFIKVANNKEGIKLDNGNQGTTSGVTPLQRIEELDVFVEEILEILEVTGINIFKEKRKVNIRETENPHRNWSEEISKEKFHLNERECDAVIVWQKEKKFIVKKGSILAKTYLDVDKQEKLEPVTRKYSRDGYIEYRKVVKDISDFKSLNKAATFCHRGSANVWTALKNEQNKSIDEVCKEIYETANTTILSNVAKA